MGVSEDLPRVVPTVPAWGPAQDAADTAAEVVSAMCPDAEELVACQYAEVTFIGQGANFEAVDCRLVPVAIPIGGLVPHEPCA